MYEVTICFGPKGMSTGYRTLTNWNNRDRFVLVVCCRVLRHDHYPLCLQLSVLVLCRIVMCVIHGSIIGIRSRVGNAAIAIVVS